MIKVLSLYMCRKGRDGYIYEYMKVCSGMSGCGMCWASGYSVRISHE